MNTFARLRRTHRRAHFEVLEARALLSAVVSVGDLTTQTSTHNVTVTYADANGIDAASLDNNDLSINGPTAIGVELIDIQGNASLYTATYSLTSAQGDWDNADNGDYKIQVNAGSISDINGAAINVDPGQASFKVNIPAPDTAGPSTDISVGNISTGGGSSHSVSVTYSDASGINAGTIGADDITVVHSGSSLSVTGVNVSGAGNSRTATYTFSALGGSWDQSDNGLYTVTVKAGAVKDNSPNANGNASDAAGFSVSVPPPADTTGPVATISVGDLTTAAATHSVTVSYVDNVNLDLSSIGPADINISFNGASLSVTNAQTSAGGDGKSATVVYTIAGPGGSFDSSDNGAYSVRIVPGAVRDQSGNAATSSPTSFNVNIPATPPADTTGPTASIAPIGTITSAGATSFNIVVTYTDDAAMDQSSIGAADLQVSRDGAGGNLSVTSAATSVSNGGKTVVATYTVAAPGGSFDTSDNGGYSVSVVANEVRDAAGNSAQAASQNFSVNIGAVPPADTTGPNAVISAAGVTAANLTSHTITVVYTDDVAVDVSSIDPADISVNGPSGALSITAASTAGSGKVVTATYTVAAPGETFDAADNGQYSVSLNGGGVRDTSGNSASGSPIAFSVAITDAPPPPQDQGPVVTSITAPNINSPGATTQTITVVYNDDGKIRANSIGADDIVVSSGGTTLSVTDVSTSASNGGKTMTAVYTVAAPGGSWDGADNGDYSIAIAAGAVVDSQGNPSSASSSSFNVNASLNDGASPSVVSVSAGDITAEGVKTQVVSVTYSDDLGLDPTSFGIDDVTVSGPGGALNINVISTSTSADGKSATVTYTFAAPGETFAFENNGVYTVAVNAGTVTDGAGKPIASASTTFTVNVPEQTPIDTGFGNGNAVNTSFVAEAVTAAPGGKLIVVGHTGLSAVIERRNSDGSIDTTFGNNGQVIRTQENAYYSVVMQGDNIVVAGSIDGDFALVRFTPGGQVDSSFGGSEHRAVITFGTQSAERADEAYALALTPDGKLVAAGRTDGELAFARFSSDGLLDTSFGQLGKQMYDLGATDTIGALQVQDDGRIVAAGTNGGQVFVIRLGTNGEADGEFSGDGLLTVNSLAARNDPSLLDRSTALALQPDGKILVGNHTAGADFGVVRIDPNGNIDSSFGNDGLATADFGGDDDADVILVQPTGEILVLGTSAVGGGTGMTTLAAFDASGKLIDAFGEGGKLMLDAAVVDSARELHLGDLVLRAFGTRQSDGRVVVGTSNAAPQQPAQQQNQQSALRRLNVPGTRSTSAGTAIGNFGVVNGRAVKLTYTVNDGTVITFSIKGGTGSAFLGADGRINLVLQDAGPGCTVAIKTKGGTGRVQLGDIMTNGSLKSLSARTGDLNGTMCVNGEVGKLLLGNVTGASICSSGNIGSIKLTSLVDSKLLAGSNLGANTEFGGTGANADAYGAASIRSLKVAGVIQNSTVGAGLDPVDATFLDEDDRVIGGATLSFIKAISAKSADSASRFLSGDFGKVKLGTKISPSEDLRFRVL